MPPIEFRSISSERSADSWPHSCGTVPEKVLPYKNICIMTLDKRPSSVGIWPDQLQFVTEKLASSLSDPRKVGSVPRSSGFPSVQHSRKFEAVLMNSKSPVMSEFRA